MNNFDDFYGRLVSGQIARVSFEGKEFKVLGVARYSSNNYPDEYIKVLFENEFVLVVSPASREISFGEFLGQVSAIRDEQIGNVETVDFNGKTYKLENRKDHQTRLELLVGGPDSVEGDCDFSDYYAKDGDCLSLGWFPGGERADVHTRTILVSDLVSGN